MQNLFIIAAFGALGAVGRYLSSSWAQRLFGESFPYGTLLVNVVGCFLLGYLMHVGESAKFLSESLRLGLAVGLLGALTTFSTFGYETFVKLESGQYGLALTNIAANMLIGLAAVWAGISLARILYGSA